MQSVGAVESTGSSQVDGSTGAGIGVTLCCAFPDLAAMQKLGALLREKGLAVEMLPGIERDANALQLQLASDEGPTIYVIANGPGLDSARLQALVQLFATERGPAHRLLVLDVDHEDPSRMVLPVVRAHDAMRKHRSSGELPRRPTKRGLEQTTEATPSPERKPAGESKDRVSRETTRRQIDPLGAEFDARESDVDALRPGTASDDRYAFGIDLPPAPAADDRSPTEYGGPTGERRRCSREVIQLPTAKRRPGSSQDIPRIEDSSPSLPRAPERAQPQRAAPQRATPQRATPPRAVPQRATPPSGTRPQRTPATPSNTPPRRVATRGLASIVEVRPARDERTSSEGPTIAPRDVPIASRKRQKPVLLLAVGGVVLTAAVALLAFGPSDDDELATQRGLVANASSAPTAEPTPPAKKAEPAREETKVADTPPEQPKRLDPTAVAQDRIDEAQRIAVALDARRIHSLDALLFVVPPEHEAPLDWTAAGAGCTGGAIDHIGGWRLPTVGEVRKLRGARRLRPGRYWTDTEAADGTAKVVASSGGRPVATAKTDKALSVCVRRRLGD